MGDFIRRNEGEFLGILRVYRKDLLTVRVETKSGWCILILIIVLMILLLLVIIT